MGSNANPLLVAQQSLAPHIAELEAEAAKIASRIVEIQIELAKCRAMQLVAGEASVVESAPRKSKETEEKP